MDGVAISCNVKLIECFLRRFRLTLGVTKRREIVLAKDQLRRGVHDAGVKLHRTMPDAAILERWATTAIENAILVVPADGREAVQAARVFTPDLILLDIQMPIMDGLEAARELRRSDSVRSIPIIAVTANDDVRRETIAAGCDACLSKPLLPDTIEKILTKYLGDPNHVERSLSGVTTIG